MVKLPYPFEGRNGVDKLLSLVCVRKFRHPDACQDAFAKHIGFSDELWGLVSIVRQKFTERES